MVLGQYPPGQYPPGQYPPDNIPPDNIPPGQNPPGQYPPGFFFFNSSVLNYPKLCAGKKNSIKKKIAVFKIILNFFFKKFKKKFVF